MGFENLDSGKEINIKKEQVKQQIKGMLGEIIASSQRATGAFVESRAYEAAKDKAKRQIELIEEMEKIEILIDRNNEDSLNEVAGKIRAIEKTVDDPAIKENLGKIADKIESTKNIEE